MSLGLAIGLLSLQQLVLSLLQHIQLLIPQHTLMEVLRWLRRPQQQNFIPLCSHQRQM